MGHPGILVLISMVFFLNACGKSDEHTNVVPQAPPQTPTESQPLPVKAPGKDTRLPPWVEVAAPIKLTQPGRYTGLDDLFGIVYPPLVGDPLVAMSLDGNRDRAVNGLVHFGFEDAKGFQFAEIPSVRNLGYRDSYFFDGIFADGEGAVRIQGTLSSNKLRGTFYYRMRASGERQCEEYITCVPGYGCSPSVDEQACRSYVDTNASQLRVLGTFEADYLKWFVGN